MPLHNAQAGSRRRGHALLGLGVGLRGTLSITFLPHSSLHESRLPRESFKRRLVGISWATCREGSVQKIFVPPPRPARTGASADYPIVGRVFSCHDVPTQRPQACQGWWRPLKLSVASSLKLPVPGCKLVLPRGTMAGRVRGSCRGSE